MILGQQPPPAALVGLAVMLAGMALVIVSNRGQVPQEAPPG